MNLIRPVLALIALLASASSFAHGGLADLAVFDRTDGRPLQVYWHENRAWIVGRPGNEYRVALRSRAGGDLLAVVSVDGVNVITGETADPAQSGYVLGPRGEVDHVGVIGMALFRRKSGFGLPAAKRHAEDSAPVPLPRRSSRSTTTATPTWRRGA